MPITTMKPRILVVIGAFAAPLTSPALAQQAPATDPNIIVTAPIVKGPEVKGVITNRSADKIRVTSADGTATVIALNQNTRIRSGGGIFGSGRNQLGPDQLLNGLPVTVKTLQTDAGLLASQISFKNGDYKTALMIRNGTAQQFEEQAAATEALRGRIADIDKYNIKGTTNVFFDTGRWALSEQAKNELCAAAGQAEATNNALILVVGYTDSVGSEEYNQVLSERRANAVINHLQQKCRWQPWRMLTPTGMAESDPLASNDTEEGKAQNRRVSVNILVSKSVEGI